MLTLAARRPSICRLLASISCLVGLAVAGLPAIAAVPATPAPVDELVYARSFRLDEGFISRWSAERPLITEGTILVLDVDPELVRPSQAAQPVLYAGDRVAQQFFGGWPSGRMIVLVPGEVDLDVEPVFFGTPELPERIDQETARAERDLALQAGILPFAGAAVADARARGGLTLRAVNAPDLDGRLAELYERYVLPLLSETD